MKNIINLNDRPNYEDRVRQFIIRFRELSKVTFIRVKWISWGIQKISNKI